MAVQLGDAPRVGTAQRPALGGAAVINSASGVPARHGVRHPDQKTAFPIRPASGGRKLHTFTLKRRQGADHIVTDQFASTQRDQIGHAERNGSLSRSIKAIEQGQVVPMQHRPPKAATLAAAFTG